MQQIPFRPWAVDEDWGFEIKGGTFENVVVQIKKLELVENSDGNCELEFHIIKKPESIDAEQFKTQEFNDIVTSIIQEVIKMAVDEAAKVKQPEDPIVEGILDENRDSNPPEPDPR
jgi:hypothetical protein